MSRLGDLRRALRLVLNTRPRRFQLKGVEFLEDRQGRGLIGDDMGVGKTLQVLGYLALHLPSGYTVVVCPSNAKYEWEDQIYEHTKFLECQVLEGQTPYRLNPKKPIIIVNFEILPYWVKYLQKKKPKALIIDECHYVKTRKILRTKACKKLSKRAKIFIPMSGTAIISKPIEFFPVLNMLNPGEFRSYWKYAMRYCDPRRGFRGRGWDFNGATRTEELHERVSEMMIRRMKEEVLKELPPKQRIVIPVNLDNKKEYNRAKDNFLLWYGDTFGAKKKRKAERGLGFVRLGQLKRLAAEGKIKAAIRWIDDYLETTGKKIVVFSHHRAVFKELVSHYGSMAAVGGKKGRKRKAEVRRFQKDKSCRIFLGRLRADKESITLTAADTVLFIEMGWTPGEHDQAEDRVLRFGQLASNVYCYYMIARGTVDEYVWDLVEKKREVVGKILDGKERKRELNKRISARQLCKNLDKGKEPKCRHRRK